MSHYMDDFGIVDAPYFQDIHQKIYPAETNIKLVPNKVKLRPDRLVDGKLLDATIFVDLRGVVHVTLDDKREDGHFHVNRFSDIDLNVSRTQSISPFFGETVRLFWLNPALMICTNFHSQFHHGSSSYSPVPQHRIPGQKLLRTSLEFFWTRVGPGAVKICRAEDLQEFFLVLCSSLPSWLKWRVSEGLTIGVFLPCTGNTLKDSPIVFINAKAYHNARTWGKSDYACLSCLFILLSGLL